MINEALNRLTLRVMVDERVGCSDRALRSHHSWALLSKTICIEGSAGITENAASSRSPDVRANLTETRYRRYSSVIIEPSLVSELRMMSTMVPPVAFMTSRSVARSPPVAGPRNLSTRWLEAASVITSDLQESARVWM